MPMGRSTSDRDRGSRKGFVLLIVLAVVIVGGYLFFTRQPTGMQPVPGGRIVERPAPPGARAIEQKVVELNTATLAEVETLPGITPEYAQKIIAARPYRSISDLSRTGIPKKILDEISPPAVIRLTEPAPPTTTGR